MEKIPSFTIDHVRLLRGVYVSRWEARRYLAEVLDRLGPENTVYPA